MDSRKARSDDGIHRSAGIVLRRREAQAVAKPIEPTPVLKGRDAKRLLKRAASPDCSPEKKQYLAECSAAYRKHLAK